MPYTIFSRFFPKSPNRGASLSRFALLTVMGVMLLPAGCTATGKNEGLPVADSPLPLNRMESSVPSARSEQIFAQLKLDRALAINDCAGILDACDRLLSSREEPAALSSKSIIDAAVWLLAHDHAKDAETLTERAIKALPEDLPLLSLHSDILIQQERAGEALRLLREFSRRHPGNSQARAELALALLRNGETEQALTIFRKIPQNQLTPQIRFAYAQALNSGRHFAEAEQQLAAAVRDDTDYAEAWQLLALTKEELGKRQEALDIYQQLLAADPSNRSARLFLIRLQIHSGDMDGAVESIVESQECVRFAVAAVTMLLDEKQVPLAERLLSQLETQPHAPGELYFYHGALLYENGLDTDKALELLDRVPPVSPEYEKALRLKASIAHEKKDVRKTEKALNELRELRPNDIDVILMTSELWMQEQEYGKADALLSKAVRDFPGKEQLDFQLAFLRELQGRREEALSMMEDIVVKYPDNAFALNYVGYNLADAGRDLDRALTLIEKAVSLQPKADFIIDSLAWVHFRMGNTAEALKQIRKAVRLGTQPNETDPTMLEHYGDIAVAAGAEAEGLEAWQEAETRFSLLGDEEAAARVRSKLEKTKKCFNPQSPPSAD